jgi:hypothetical protein
VRAKPKPTPALFYSYSAAVIARWCGVSHRTALAYKRGERMPSRSVVRLFILHRDRRVFPAAWGRGWALTETAIIDPEGNEVPATWVRGYFLLLQWARGVAQERGLSREYEELLTAIGSDGNVR